MKKELFTRLENSLLKNEWVLIKTMRLLKRNRNINLGFKAWDYIRYSSLELCAFEIEKKNLQGSVAELGVFQGEFASQINRAFPERDLYLFDTFKGFDEKDIRVDVGKSYSTGKQDFSSTSVDSVLSKMKYPNKCVVKVGYFPETAYELKEPFVFVSIDTDLFKPIYDGLQFFYPKLAEGGYIFVHDFNNTTYKGAKDAVLQFCAENKIGYFPLSDICGTAIITK